MYKNIRRDHSILHLAISTEYYGLKNEMFIFLLQHSKIWCAYVVWGMFILGLHPV
jgi:hypothetical protein